MNISLEETLSEICLNLTSVRATERKRSAETLKEYLSKNALPTLLTHNTSNKTGYNWNNVFDDVNDYILKETENFETSKTFRQSTVPLCSSLLLLCVAGCNKDKAYIKCEKITKACLFVLNDNRLTEAIGDAYISVLYKHVLPYEHYLSYISPPTWKNLLDVCMSSFNRLSNLDDLIKTRLLWLVVQNACDYSQFAIPLRNSLGRLKKCCIRALNNKKVQEYALKIVILILETLSSESRLTVCEFTENILPPIFKMYEQSMELKKKSLLFKLCEMAIKIHNPLGRLPGDAASLAHNWDTWNRNVSSMSEIVCREVTCTQKMKIQSDLSLTQCDYFCYVGASTFFQAFNTTENMIGDISEAENSAKKIRKTFNTRKSFNELIEELNLNCSSWIGIVQMYVKHYRRSISHADYVSLLRVFESYIQDQKDINWDRFEDLSCMVINNLLSLEVQDACDVLIPLWNTCVRNAAVSGNAQKAVHSIIIVILNSVPLKYDIVKPLLLLYIEKGIPVNNHTVSTLNSLYHKFYRKTCYIEMREKYFSWLVNGNIINLRLECVKELLLRLLCDDNIGKYIYPDSSESENIYDVIFKCTDKSILYSDFEYRPADRTEVVKETLDHFEMNSEMNNRIDVYLEQTLYLRDVKNLNDYCKYLNIVIAYINLLLKYKLKTINEVSSTSIYLELQAGLRHLYTALTQILTSDIQIWNKVAILKSIQDILMNDNGTLLDKETRNYIDKDCFHCVYNIIKGDVTTDDGDACNEGEIEYTSIGLKQNCIYLLAAYCRCSSLYTEDILKCILDHDLYNFSSNWDTIAALGCLQILNDARVEQTLELSFRLIQDMCKELFRYPKATRGLLLIMKEMLNDIWNKNDPILQENCYIMINSYLQRCERSFYPPDVAASLYECVAKVVKLNNHRNLDVHNSFKDILPEKIKGADHRIRLYSCHLLALIADGFSIENFHELSEKMLQIFLINVSDDRETVLQDELMNRTAAVLHFFYVLGVSNRSSIHQIILKIIEFQNEKNMDKTIVKKVLDILTKTVTDNSIEDYMNSNVIRVLEYWFQDNKSFDSLPLFLFGFENMDELLEKHLKWVVATDVIWRSNGSVEKSEVLKYARNKTKQSLEKIVEMCFSNIVALSLPYIVTGKYKIVTGRRGLVEAGDANRMFQSTRQILKDDKWSNLFVENLGELVLITARHISDHSDASQMFGIQLMKDNNSYTYPKSVFLGILKYFGELIDGNIMQYLCENQPLLLFNILFKLWDKVLREKVYTYKVLAFHAYLAFVDNIPFGLSSDAILNTFACANIANALKKSQTKEDIKIFVDGLKILSTKILTHGHGYGDKFKITMLPKMISIINFKIAEGYTECDSLLRYLTQDVMDNFVEDEDVVDFINVMSQYQTNDYSLATKYQFRDKLRTYASSLSHASHETIAKLTKLIKHNKLFLNDLHTEASEKGFSEDCKTSVVHRIISLLSNLMKTTSDDKVIAEACNCLAEIGSYDIKTLVTVPPADTSRIVELPPDKYFAESSLSSLSEHLFDTDPSVSNAIAKAISQLFKFIDGKAALDAVDSDKDILVSLSSVAAETYAKYKIDNKKFDLYNSEDYWIPINDENHSQWVLRITQALLDLLSSPTNYLSSLSTVCTMKPSICKKILPALMGLILYCSTDIHTAVIGVQINQVFKYIWDVSFDEDLETADVAGTPRVARRINHDNKMIINYMLDIVDSVRVQRGHYRSRPRVRHLETLNYLNLEYRMVSWAATVAEQHFSAIFYMEIGAAAVGCGEHWERILRRCYVSIGEMDAIDGCGTAHLTIEHEKRKHLINMGQYADALLLCDIALSRGNGDDNVLYGAVTSLHRSGMHHLALQYIKSYPQSDKLDDIKYDCLSYLGDWSDFVDTVELEDKSRIGSFKQDSIIKAMRYSCLKDCLNIKPTLNFDMKLDKPLIRAKLATARLCRSLNMENCQSVYKLVGYLHLFRDIERYFSVRCGKMSLSELIDEWKVNNLPVFNDFKHLEALISQRSLILEHAAGSHSVHLSEITDLQLEYSELGLSNQRIQMAQRLVASVKNDQSSKKVALIESQITWAKGHKDIALSLLDGLIAQNSQDKKLAAMSLRQYGLWMSQSKRENARDVIHKYLEKSLEALNTRDDNETRFKLYHDIATFADAEYKQMVSYMNSSVFENKVKCVENMKGTAASLKSSQQKLTKDERKTLITYNAFGILDEAEIINTKGEKESFLKMAMKYYLLSLRHCDDNNLSVFRVISLWFDNPEFNFQDEDLARDLEAVPSWKFITVLPQLAPRLSNENTPFANNLKKIIKRCALEHPHHTLPILFNLKNSDKDGGGSVSLARPGEARVLTAAALIQELAHTELSVPISQMELICDAIISLAYHKPKYKETKNHIPKAEPISRLRNLNAIPIPTDTIAVRKDCDYSKLNTLSSFNDYFELVGGINCPKKISCTRSDGKNIIMLIKGEDDLRQDAVMQQVFNIVNTLLEKNPITDRNKLLIRTYKVVAMSRRSGALEWCAGTQPLGGYLGDAHLRYRPTDITPSAARTKMKDCHENGRSVRQKLEAFNGILKAFKPVFHHFFTEHYLDPVTWYERRLAYTRSVATSSMVGYIMGLGDRHVQNILIDKTTAEVIHIDFGIAFDQGKTLPTPETVPFRLTQDIIAGFGSSGVEGIFRRCCERTLQLLRDHQEILLTILEVLLCDPLYLWIVSTNYKSNTSNSRSPSSSGLAARALLAVRSKLSGAEGAGRVSVAGDVARLLAEARDPANLCRLFPGWQPYF